MSPDARTRVGNFGGFRWLALAFVLHGVNGIAGVVGPAFISDERTSPFGLAGMSRVERPVGGRFVKVNPGLSEMARVSLDVAPGIRLEAERIRLDRFQGRDFVWVGRLVGEPLSEVVLASRDGVLAGVIDRPVVDGNVVHAITPPDGGGSVLAEYDPVEAGRVDCRTLEPSVDGGRRARRGLLGTRNLAPSATYPAATAENPAVVDVMVVYTPATTTRHGGAPGVEALILQAVSSANTAYQNSGVHQALNLVAMSEVPYVEPGDMIITLTRL